MQDYILYKKANKARLQSLYRMLGVSAKDAAELIHSTPKGSPERFRAVMGLRRMFKPETWYRDKPHRLTKLIKPDLLSGKPYVFRGEHDIAEPLHLSGSSLSHSAGPLDISRPTDATIRDYRHVTMWPETANLYARNGTGMHKGTRSNFGVINVYRAKDFPEITANQPGLGFSSEMVGRTRAQFRDMPHVLDDYRRKLIADDVAGSKRVVERYKGKGINGLRELIEDELPSGLPKSGSKAHRLLRLQRAANRAKFFKIREEGPLDQLKDMRRAISDPTYLENVANDSAVTATQELVVKMKGRSPSHLFFRDLNSPFGHDTYYDATDLMNLYQNASSMGNNKVKNLIGSILKSRFGYNVE